MSENTGHLFSRQDGKDENEKIYLENDKCLEDGPLKREKETIPEKIRRKFACLGLTWPGLLILLIISIILLIFLIIIIVLAVQLALYQKHYSNICTTPNCLRTSANIMEKMDQTVNPCTDFYAFSCGKWNNMEKNGYGVSAYGHETRLNQHLREYYGRIRELLNTKAYSSNVSSVEWKMKSFYESCMNTESIEAASIHSLKRIIDRLYGWNVLADWVQSHWDTNDILRRLHVEFGVNPFFRPVVMVDDKVAKIEIIPSGLGLPYKKFYFRNHYDSVVEAYIRLMHDTAVLFGATGPNAKSFANEVFNFERRLAIVYPDTDYRSRLRYPQELISVSELSIESRQIVWREYLNKVFPGYAVPDSTKILANKTYLQEVSRLFSSTDYAILNNYMIWTLVRHYAPYLSKNFRTILDNFQTALTGSTQSVDRWEFCVKEVEKLFPIGIGALYVDNYVSMNEIENVKKYFKEISETLVDRIDEYDWMDYESKQKTKKMVDEAMFYDKFPSGINNTKMIQHYLDLIILKSDFFQNIIKGVDFQNFQSVKWLKDQTNLLWHSRSHYFQQYTPYITISRKHLVVPYYLIQKPVFDSNQFAALNFGSLGWLLGRAMIQGFENADVVNKNWDEPFLPIWWNNSTCEMYESHQKCVIHEYSKNFVTIEGINDKDEEISFDAVTTEDENMADVGGLTLAYYSFMNWGSKYSDEKLLPVIPDYTKEQLFFISYGQSLCSELKIENLFNELDASKFSPNHIRVNGAVSQIPEFSYAFGCSYSSPMNAEQKCETW